MANNKTGEENKENIEGTWNLENIKDKAKVTLYVGKTTNILGRIGLHLKLGTEDWYKGFDNNKKGNYIYKKTSSCQLRAGLRHTSDMFEVFMVETLASTIRCQMLNVIMLIKTEIFTKLYSGLRS